MKQGVNLELKHHCPNFRPVRMLLKKIGAKKVATKKQKDFFFHLPPQKDNVCPRMKLRIEKGKQTLVYYRRPNFSKHTVTTSELMLYHVRDTELLHFLERVLGVSAVVEKQREFWRLGEAVFHLDCVKGAGNIFEIELQKKGSVTTKDRKLFAYYQKLFTPRLGKIVKGSNGDLLAHRFSNASPHKLW